MLQILHSPLEGDSFVLTEDSEVTATYITGIEDTTNFTINSPETEDNTPETEDNQTGDQQPNPQEENNNNSTTQKANNPKTRDNIVMYTIVFAVALLGITTLVVVNKRKKVTK